MSDADRAAAIDHQLRYGDEALRAAHALRGLALFNDTLSRLYYAVFHHALAVLMTEGVEPRRHRALPDLLASRFQKTGALTATDVAAVARLASYRDMADDGHSWEATSEVVEAAFSDALPLISRLRRILEQAGAAPSSG